VENAFRHASNLRLTRAQRKVKTIKMLQKYGIKGLNNGNKAVLGKDHFENQDE
jgi:hypothetical protein